MKNIKKLVVFLGLVLLASNSIDAMQPTVLPEPNLTLVTTVWGGKRSTKIECYDEQDTDYFLDVNLRPLQPQVMAFYRKDKNNVHLKTDPAVYKALVGIATQFDGLCKNYSYETCKVYHKEGNIVLEGAIFSTIFNKKSVSSSLYVDQQPIGLVKNLIKLFKMEESFSRFMGVGEK